MKQCVKDEKLQELSVVLHFIVGNFSILIALKIKQNDNFRKH